MTNLFAGNLREEAIYLFNERRIIRKKRPIDHSRMKEIMDRSYDIEEMLVFGKKKDVCTKENV